jgi:hypothetical protein
MDELDAYLFHRHLRPVYDARMAAELGGLGKLGAARDGNVVRFGAVRAWCRSRWREAAALLERTR